jgi:uncharacterized membrane protein YhaH (DUF805 family)
LPVGEKASVGPGPSVYGKTSRSHRRRAIGSAAIGSWLGAERAARGGHCFSMAARHDVRTQARGVRHGGSRRNLAEAAAIGGNAIMGLVRFFSLAPRVSVIRWVAWFAATLAVAWLCILALQRVEGAALVAAYAALGVSVAKLATESVRRLHDCGQSGRLGLKVILGVLALAVTGILHWMGYGPGAVFWAAEGLAAVALAVLMLRPGMLGINAYGPPVPAPFAVSGETSGRTGSFIAAVFLLAGVGFGFAVLDWQRSIDRNRELRTRVAEESL